MKKNIPKRYNWKKDKFDPRDKIYIPQSLTLMPALPAHVDLRSACPPVMDQGQMGSCTSQALAGAMDFLEISKDSRAGMLSRLFIYFNEREIEGTVSQDSGAQLRDGVKSLNKLGVCHENLWPYKTDRIFEKPSAAAYTDGLGHKIESYERITSLEGMKAALASGLPFVFGFQVYSGFESAAVAASGVVDLPLPGETVLGGHAVMAVGYDDTSKRFIVRNSWGSTWGQAGYFTLPYDYLISKNDLANDFWVLKRE